MAFDNEQGDSEIVDEARTVNLMATLVQSFRLQVPAVCRQFGEEKSQEFEDEIKFKIASQLYNLPELSRGYYLWKIKAGLDPRTLIATGEYLNAITHEEVPYATEGITFRIGLIHGLHSGSGLSFATLQRFLESGTSRMPARPHWGPQMELWRLRSTDMGRELRSLLASAVQVDMR